MERQLLITETTSNEFINELKVAIKEMISEEITKEQIRKEREEYLTAQQTAEILQISLVTLWSWDKKGITKAYRIGSKKLYKRGELDSFMKVKP
jgi:hypothetical protein